MQNIHWLKYIALPAHSERIHKKVQTLKQFSAVVIEIGG